MSLLLSIHNFLEIKLVQCTFNNYFSTKFNFIFNPLYNRQYAQERIFSFILALCSLCTMPDKHTYALTSGCNLEGIESNQKVTNMSGAENGDLNLPTKEAVRLFRIFRILFELNPGLLYLLRLNKRSLYEKNYFP